MAYDEIADLILELTILKYADDTTLLVSQNSSVTLQAEFAHLLDRSNDNKLTVNKLKTKEIVFHRPCLPNKLLSPLLPGIERVDLACSPYQPFDLSVQPSDFFFSPNSNTRICQLNP